MYRMGGIDNTTKYATHKGNCRMLVYNDNRTNALAISWLLTSFLNLTIFGHGGRHCNYASAGTLSFRTEKELMFYFVLNFVGSSN